MAFKYAVVLTGGIATGKSTVAELFKSYGFSIVDADKTAHKMLIQHHEEIKKMFGDAYVKGSVVDRKALGRLIFSNKEEKLRLEKFLHPLIFEDIREQSSRLDALKKPYLVDIPLFFESGRYEIEESIVVYVPKSLQLQRLVERDKTTEVLAQQRIDAQMDIEEKKQRATYLIDNQGDLNALQQLCVKVKDKIIIKYKEK